MVAAGIGLQHACVNSEALAFDQAKHHRGANDLLEDMTQDVTLAEATEAIDGERRVMRDWIVEIESAKPPVGQVEVDLLTQPPFRSNAVAVPDDEHPDHEFRVDRRAPDIAVEGAQLGVEVFERHRYEGIDPP